MSTREEEKWLRAVLEGEVKPGDAAWRRMWREEEFAGVRQVLEEVGMCLEDGEKAFDKARVWRAIEQHCAVVKEKKYMEEVIPNITKKEGVRRAWERWAAVLVLPLVAGCLLWWLGRESEKMPESIPVGQEGVLLVTAQGERIDLTAIQEDTLLERGAVQLRFDDGREMRYVQRGDDRQLQTGTVKNNVLTVPRKGEYRLVLADGSKVFLNAETELRYPSVFTGGVRRVELKGEAFFEVAPDAAHPFVVEAGGMEVRVLGTRFNVNAYEPEQAVRTTLLSGKVEVRGKKNSIGQASAGASVTLQPGQQAVWEGGRISTRQVNAEAVAAWVEGRYYFEDGATLEEIAGQICRWYDLDFFFTSERVKGLVFAGVIKRDYTAEQIFGMIEKATRVKFTLNGRTVVVSEP